MNHLFKASVAALVLLAVPAAAQTPNPIMQHYRAYAAALGAGDLATAEREADAALAASVARDGDGGRTAVLALNLASVRLERGRAAEALAPAQRASTIAQANPSSGVDPVAASLAVARAELMGDVSAGTERANTAIAAAEQRGEFKIEAHETAMALGARHMRQQRFDDAEAAYRTAVRLAAGEEEAMKMARANALVGQGMALMLLESPGRSTADTGSTLLRRPNGRPDAAFASAIELVQPLALQGAPGGAITRAQAVYANALAWEALQRARLQSLGWRIPDTGPRALMIDASPADGLPPCAFGVRTEPGPIYPQELLRDQYGGTGAVVRILTNEAGEIVQARTLAVAGGVALTDAINSVAPRWSIIPSEPTEACNKAAVLILPMTYYISN